MLSFAIGNFEVPEASWKMPTWAVEVSCDHMIPYACCLTSWHVFTASEIGEAGSKQC